MTDALTLADDPAADDDRRLWQSFRHHSRTFSFAARLLPRPMRVPVATLYLFCRSVDTLADERQAEIGADAALRELDELRVRLDATLAGAPPPAPLWQRMAAIDRDIGLNAPPLHQLIEGARWDLEGRGIATEADLLHYSDLVGGCVGAMMLPFLTRRKGDVAALDGPARALGVAMQITNILRDVGEDARLLGRVYLPSDLLAEHGIAPDALAGSRVPDGYPELVERLAGKAETLYDEGLDGVEALPAAVRRGIRAAACVYREILNEVRANGYDNLTQRAFVPARRKVLRVAHDGYAGRRARLLGP
jgi:phytoene synthase